MPAEDVTPGRAYGYIRVSTGDQADNGQSILDQEAKTKDYVDRVLVPKGYSGFRLFREEGVSAYTRPFGKRPQGSILLSQIKAGDCLVIPKLDRAFRSSLDGQQVLAFLKAQRAKVVILDFDGSTIDFDSTYGRLMLSTMLNFGEFESGMKSDRIKASLDYCRKTRGFTVCPPPGYRVQLVSGKKQAVIDDTQLKAAEQVLRTFWSVGLGPTLKALSRKEIVVATKFANGATRAVKAAFDDDAPGRQQWHNVWVKCICGLWNGGRLERLCYEFGKNIDHLCDPENGIVFLPNRAAYHKKQAFLPEGRARAKVHAKQTALMASEHVGGGVPPRPVAHTEPVGLDC